MGATKKGPDGGGGGGIDSEAVPPPLAHQSEAFVLMRSLITEPMNKVQVSAALRRMPCFALLYA